MMPPLPPEAYIPAFGAMSIVIAAQWVENKGLVREILKIATEAVAAMKDLTAKTDTNTASVDHLTEEVRRGS